MKNKTLNTLINKNIINLTEVKDDSVDLIVTSPPYKEKDGFTLLLMYQAFLKAWHMMRDSRLLFVNFGHLKEDKRRPFVVEAIISEIGFTLQDTIIWEKTQYTPIPGNNLNNIFEFIFIFSKGEMPDIDRLSIGRPYKDKSNVSRYGKGKDLVCSGNVWHFGYETVQSSKQKQHPDMFPEELPRRCIKLAGGKKKIKTVADIFLGSGTTGVVCQELGIRNFIGVEINENTFKKAEQWLKKRTI